MVEASDDQRRRRDELLETTGDCLGCGRAGRVHPAHLVWQKLNNGCRDPDCILPLCTKCHRKFDKRSLNLLLKMLKPHLHEGEHRVHLDRLKVHPPESLYGTDEVWGLLDYVDEAYHSILTHAMGHLEDLGRGYEDLYRILTEGCHFLLEDE